MSDALLGYLLEPAAVAIQEDRLIGQLRVPLANHVHVLGIEFYAIADALGQFSSGERRATPQEGFIYYFAAIDVIQDRAPHQLDRFLRGVIKLLLIGSTHDELGGWRIPDCGAFARLSEPRRVLFSHVPTRFVLIPVVRSRQHDAALVPDDLLRIKESDVKQPVQHFARE